MFVVGLRQRLSEEPVSNFVFRRNVVRRVRLRHLQRQLRPEEGHRSSHLHHEHAGARFRSQFYKTKDYSILISVFGAGLIKSLIS